jgi:hypothetical protein
VGRSVRDVENILLRKRWRGVVAVRRIEREARAGRVAKWHIRKSRF